MDSSIVLEEAAEEGNLYTSADAEVWIYLSDLSVSDLFASWQESDRKRKGHAPSAQCLRAEAKRRMASSRHQQQPLRLQPHDIFSFLSP